MEAEIAGTRRYGSIEPLHDEATAAVIARSEQLLPPTVVKVLATLDTSDYDGRSVDDAMRRYWACVDQVVGEGAERIFLVGFPISAQIGRQRCLELLAETTDRTGVVASSDAEATLEALAHLGARSVAIGSRWAKEVNDALVRYLTDGGMEVLHVTDGGQWVAGARAMSIERGVTLAVELARDAHAHAPTADAVVLPGGYWRVLAAVPLLEPELGKPVVSNLTALPWRLMHDGWAPPVQGWGELLAHP